MVLLWLKTGGKALLTEGVVTDLQVTLDSLSVRNFGESLPLRAKQASQRLLHDAINYVTQSGSGINDDANE